MSERQAAGVIGLVLLVFVAIGLAAYVMQGRADSSAALSTRDRFAARPGTTRENAVALSTVNREASRPPHHQETASEDDDPLPVLSISPPDQQRALPEEAQILREAINSFRPESGIAKLEAALDMPMHPVYAVAMASTLGELYAQLDPPRYHDAEAAFERARGFAQTNAQRQEILGAEVEVLLARGNVELALARIDDALALETEQTTATMRLYIQQGRCFEALDRADDAETAYQQALRVGDALLANGAQSEVLPMRYRDAAFRLTGLLRDRGDHAAADAASTAAGAVLDTAVGS